MFVPSHAFTTGMMSIAGTQNTTSASSVLTSGFNVSTSATASDGVMFIFQFPAMIFFLAMVIYPHIYQFYITKSGTGSPSRIWNLGHYNIYSQGSKCVHLLPTVHLLVFIS